MAAVVGQRPGHACSKVVRDGQYGTPGHKRQQCRCTPNSDDPPHRFTPVLPRLCDHDGERWLDCEHVIDCDEGPRVARTYGYSSRDIADALRAVGTGRGYIEVADSARKLARRTWHTPCPHGQLVADWTEVGSPVHWETFRPTKLPERLIGDSTPFYVTPSAVRRKYQGRRPPKGSSVSAFEVCCVAGAHLPGYRPELVALVAGPVVDQAAWEQVLRLLPPRQPLSVISDEDNSLAKAVAAVGPTDPVTGVASPEMQLGTWHLSRGYREEGAPLIQRQNLDRPVWVQLEEAFSSPQAWHDCYAVARRGGGVRSDPRVIEWAQMTRQVSPPVLSSRARTPIQDPPHRGR